MIVESGVYNLASATNGTSSSTLRIDGQVVYGSDYDRVAKNNDNLEIYFCASGSWGGIFILIPLKQELLFTLM